MKIMARIISFVFWFLKIYMNLTAYDLF